MEGWIPDAQSPTPDIQLPTPNSQHLPGGNPFATGAPPDYLRVERYKYRFAKPATTPRRDPETSPVEMPAGGAAITEPPAGPAYGFYSGPSSPRPPAGGMGESKAGGGSERGAEGGGEGAGAWWVRERIGPLYAREKIFSLRTV